MLRAVFVFLVALGAALYFPGSRAMVLDATEPVLNPVFRWSTRGEMRKIVRDLETLSQTGRPFPTDQDAFERWMDRTYRGITSTLDAWENTYVLRVSYDTFVVIAPGPDGEPDTADDVVLSGELDRSVRRR